MSEIEKSFKYDDPSKYEYSTSNTTSNEYVFLEYKIKECEALKQKLQIAVETLEFFKNELKGLCKASPDPIDFGEKAKQALEKIKSNSTVNTNESDIENKPETVEK